MLRCMTWTVTGNEFSSVTKVLYISIVKYVSSSRPAFARLRQRENYFFARTGGKLKNASQMSVRVHKQPQFFLFSTKIDMITNLQFTFLQRDTEFLQCSN